MLVEPSELDEVISVTPAMRPNCRSSGVATDDAIVSGLAPGSDADTEIVGKSTCGSGDTGSSSNATRAGQAERDHQQRGRDRPANEDLRRCSRRGRASDDVSPCRENRAARRSNQR